MGMLRAKDIALCHERLLLVMVQQGLTLRQIAAIFREFTVRCRCWKQQHSVGEQEEATPGRLCHRSIC